MKQHIQLWLDNENSRCDDNLPVFDVDMDTISDLHDKYFYDHTINDLIKRVCDLFYNCNTLIIYNNKIFDYRKGNNTEAYIGLRYTNNLRKLFPNFIYIYGYHDEEIIYEKINYDTKLELLSKDERKRILFQLLLSIYKANKEYGFYLPRLDDNNIGIIKSDNKFMLRYDFEDQTFYMETSIIAIVYSYKNAEIEVNKDQTKPMREFAERMGIIINGEDMINLIQNLQNKYNDILYSGRILNDNIRPSLLSIYNNQYDPIINLLLTYHDRDKYINEVYKLLKYIEDTNLVNGLYPMLDEISKYYGLNIGLEKYMDIS
jgi:hypothetical protein